MCWECTVGFLHKFVVLEARRSLLHPFFQKAVPVIQKSSNDLPRSCFLLLDLVYLSVVKRQNLGIWVAEQDWRMGRNDELRVLEFSKNFVYQHDKRQRSLWRKRGFGFIE